MKLKYIKYTFGIAFVIAVVVSCGKMDATYADLIKGGEISYTGKPDSVKAHPGNGRLKLSWLLISDPKITKCKVFWNDRADSIEVPITRKAGIDSVNVLLNNMPEKRYVFELFSYDNEGHSSVKVIKSASVYGSNYASGLFGREINSAKFDKNLNAAVLTWFDANGGDVGTEVNYTNKAGKRNKIIVPSSIKANVAVMLPDFVSGNSIDYRTAYIPDSLAIDTFRTEFKSLVIK